jgi:dephospho-CoA kinase
MNKIIGLFGMMCSGKDTVADLLYKRGYTKISISEDVLKPVLNSLRVKPNRLNYIKLGKSLKNFKKESLAFLAHALMNKGTGHKYVIPNIMTFQEARFLKEQEDINFFLIKVSADQRLRYERNLQRMNEKDVNNLATFIRLDKKNLAITGLKELMHARIEDAKITNDGSIDELEKRLDKVIKELGL